MALTDTDNLMNGRADHTCDDKNRMILPQRFRELLGSEFVLTMGPHHSIRAYPKPVFEQLASLVASRSILDEFDDNSTMLQRMIGNSELVSLDSQFRITIPKYLKEWADLKEDVPNAIFGSGSRIEIWNRENWARVANEAYTDESVKAATRSRLAELSAADAPTLGAA